MQFLHNLWINLGMECEASVISLGIIRPGKPSHLLSFQKISLQINLLNKKAAMFLYFILPGQPLCKTF